MFVRDWMSAPAIVIPPRVPAATALEFMDHRRIRRMPVVQEGRLVGIVTRSDLLAAPGRGEPVGPEVADVMTKDPHTVEPDETLERAAQVMLERKVSGLPVVKDGKVAGIITESDVFRALCGMLGIGERGARMVMTVPDSDALLEAIEKRVNGLALRSLVTVHDPKHGCWNVVLRVRGRTAAAPSSR